MTYESVLVELTGTFRDPEHPWRLDDSKVGFTPSGSKCAYRSVTWTTDEGLEPLIKASHWEGDIADSVQDRLAMMSTGSTTSMNVTTTASTSGRSSCKDFPIDVPDP